MKTDIIYQVNYFAHYFLDVKHHLTANIGICFWGYAQSHHKLLATLCRFTVGWVTNYSHHPWLRLIATVTYHYKARLDDSVSSLLLLKIPAIMWPGDPNLSSKTATLVQNHQEDHQEDRPCGEINFKCPGFAMEEMLNISLWLHVATSIDLWELHNHDSLQQSFFFLSLSKYMHKTPFKREQTTAEQRDAMLFAAQPQIGGLGDARAMQSLNPQSLH